jgi:hypothetical protein
MSSPRLDRAKDAPGNDVRAVTNALEQASHPVQSAAKLTGDTTGTLHFGG